jgi:hypothetical protein
MRKPCKNQITVTGLPVNALQRNAVEEPRAGQDKNLKQQN